MLARASIFAAIILAALGVAQTAGASTASYQPTASIAALEDYGVKSAQIAHAAVASFHDGTNSGGGMFDWVAGACTPDGGIWIAAKDVSAKAGCWRRLFAEDQCWSVSWFGTYGDGKHDDADALRNIANALPHAGGCIYIPRTDHCYNFSKPLPWIRTNVTIKGDGNRSHLCASANAQDGIVNPENHRVFGVTLEDFFLDTAPGVRGTNGIRATDITGLTCRSVVVGASTGNGFTNAWLVESRAGNGSILDNFYNCEGRGARGGFGLKSSNSSAGITTQKFWGGSYGARGGVGMLVDGSAWTIHAVDFEDSTTGIEFVNQLQQGETQYCDLDAGYFEGVITAIRFDRGAQLNTIEPNQIYSSGIPNIVADAGNRNQIVTPQIFAQDSSAGGSQTRTPWDRSTPATIIAYTSPALGGDLTLTLDTKPGKATYGYTFRFTTPAKLNGHHFRVVNYNGGTLDAAPGKTYSVYFDGTTYRPF